LGEGATPSDVQRLLYQGSLNTTLETYWHVAPQQHSKTYDMFNFLSIEESVEDLEEN
jgi:hypothetical protein